MFANIKVTADYKNILFFIEALKRELGTRDNTYNIKCGYEAGCLGYSLYNQLIAASVRCTILASSTMMDPQGNRGKTNAWAALIIVQYLPYGGYKPIYVPIQTRMAR